MPTSDPWNPNQQSSRTLTCWTCGGLGCTDCSGDGCFEEEVLYREDQKIRCTLGTPAGPVQVLFWDNIQIYEFKSRVTDQQKHFCPARNWHGDAVDIIPKHVVYFQRNDP